MNKMNKMNKKGCFNNNEKNIYKRHINNLMKNLIILLIYYNYKVKL